MASTLVPKSTDSDPQNVNNMADIWTTTLAIKHPADIHLPPSSTSLSDISTYCMCVKVSVCYITVMCVYVCKLYDKQCVRS